MLEPGADRSTDLVGLLEEQLARKDERIAMLEAMIEQVKQDRGLSYAGADGPTHVPSPLTAERGGPTDTSGSAGPRVATAIPVSRTPQIDSIAASVIAAANARSAAEAQPPAREPTARLDGRALHAAHQGIEHRRSHRRPAALLLALAATCAALGAWWRLSLPAPAPQQRVISRNTEVASEASTLHVAPALARSHPGAGIEILPERSEARPRHRAAAVRSQVARREPRRIQAHRSRRETGEAPLAASGVQRAHTEAPHPLTVAVRRTPPLEYRRPMRRRRTHYTLAPDNDQSAPAPGYDEEADRWLDRLP